MMSTDPYWNFDTQNHFRPKVDTTEFFKLSSFEFGLFLFHALSDYIVGENYDDETLIERNELIKGKNFSPAQKALYYWWQIDRCVPDGFVEIFFKGLGRYIPVVTKALLYLGDTEMPAYLERAATMYHANAALFDKARKAGEEGLSDLRGEMEEMEELIYGYSEVSKKTMHILEDYFRKNPNEIVLDEDGQELQADFTGELTAYHYDGVNAEIFHVKDGLKDGEFRRYNNEGIIEEVLHYEKGILVNRREFFEDGTTSYVITMVKDGGTRHEWFYRNGNPKKLVHKLVNEDDEGPFMKWFENGNISEKGIYIADGIKHGEWEEFYETGIRKTEGKFENDHLVPHNHWNAEGALLLSNGTGIYVSESPTSRFESEYRNYKPHGTRKIYKEGHLNFSQEMNDGLPHGITRRFYSNGKLELEILFEKGIQVSMKKYPMFEEPVVQTRIMCEIEDFEFEQQDLNEPDEPAQLQDTEDAAETFNPGITVFDGYPHFFELECSYFVFIDKKGNVTKLKFVSATDKYLREKVKRHIQDLKFILAMLNRSPVVSGLNVTYKLSLAEKQQ